MAHDRATLDGMALQRMPQQEMARIASDDWTGVIDRAQRRKLQNRLNQRAYRSRKQPSTGQTRDPMPGRTVVPAGPPPDLHHDQHSGGQLVPLIPQSPSFRCSLAPRDADQRMANIERRALESHLLGAPNLDHLISLSRVNVQRAVMANILAVGMNMEWMIDDDSISRFNLSCPQMSTDDIPSSLRPTAVQLSIAHHPWLDVFPFPNMRDNLISSSDSFDDEELCRDLMGFWDTHDSRATLLVWGTPHDPGNWEVTPGFFAKWGWLLKGCSELVVSSNRWRAQRGERPLFRRSKRPINTDTAGISHPE